MPHSYVELRSAAIQVLLGKAKDHNGLGIEAEDYDRLKIGVGRFLDQAEGRPSRPPINYEAATALPQDELDSFREVFWDLFRQGIITLGKDEGTREFPYFSITAFGRTILKGDNAYFVHDVSGYQETLLREIPHLDLTTLIYLEEALQAFLSGCLLASSVMLGVATEHTFFLLLETIEANPAYKSSFSRTLKERSILRKIETFRRELEPYRNGLPPKVKEALETNLFSILEIIRSFRNDAGHPSGEILSREQAHSLLLLFPRYCRRVYQMKEHFGV